MTSDQAAWLAGLFEGEGCIEYTGKYGVRLCIGMTDPDVVQRVRELAGGTITVQQQGPRDPGGAVPKPRHAWRLSSMREIKPLLEVLLPWLGERRSAKARGALERMAASPRGPVKDRTHCRDGHEFTPENTYVRPSAPTHKTCVICYRASARARYRAKHNVPPERWLGQRA